ncbi:hypothetical protein U8527_00710 [Kordia algicida OT-1]|uniref:Uncharacterized protein n=1 Tax=Kordia algicida OT-1 TaxID=391587 RepID=A9DRL9_9FLAO|nr:hypothetical protein [Kordia algicida]EDP96813.1 hypothetical protein KAOT1_16658 [Kordia algicida OT-1]
MKKRVNFKITKEGVITPDTLYKEDILLHYFLVDKDYFALEQIENLEKFAKGELIWSEHTKHESFGFAQGDAYVEIIEDNVHLIAFPPSLVSKYPTVIIPIKELIKLMKSWYKFQVMHGVDPKIL